MAVVKGAARAEAVAKALAAKGLAAEAAGIVVETAATAATAAALAPVVAAGTAPAMAAAAAGLLFEPLDAGRGLRTRRVCSSTHVRRAC